MACYHPWPAIIHGLLSPNACYHPWPTITHDLLSPIAYSPCNYPYLSYCSLYILCLTPRIRSIQLSVSRSMHSNTCFMGRRTTYVHMSCGICEMLSNTVVSYCTLHCQSELSLPQLKGHLVDLDSSDHTCSL